MGKEIDPADIGKHPDLIRKAQADMTQNDVLVCGRCHNVFHFIELFKEHKEQECQKESTLKDCRETKAKVWAFLLWKSAQINPAESVAALDGGTPNSGSGGAVNSWKLYQTWVKLEESVRETWIVAGRTIQSFARMGQGNLQEMPVKITKTIIESGPDDKKINNATGTPNRFTPTRKPQEIRSTPNSLPASAAATTTDAKKPAANAAAAATAGLTSSSKKPELPVKPTGRSVAKRTTPGSGEVIEEEVEKILAKRFNPRRKEHEYLVKWSKFAHDQNTWEPLIHLQTCQSVLEYFEVQLAKQKEQRAAAAARTLQQQQAEKAKAMQGAGTTPTSTGVTPGLSPAITVTKTTAAAGTPASAAATTATATNTPGGQTPVNVRPVRNSKVNALDKVKQWVGSSTAAAGGSSSDEAATAKRKLDPDSEYDGEEEDTDGGGSAVKKLKTDSSASVSQALAKAQQSGNLRVVPVGAKSPVKVVNGTATISASALSAAKKDASADPNSAEVILKSTKDGTATGVVKKPGFTVAGGKPAVAGDAKVQIVNRGEATKLGVFKVGTASSSPQGSPPGTTGAITRTGVTTHQGPPGTTTTTTTRIVRKNIGGQQQLVKQVVRTTIPIQHAQAANQQQQQTGGTPLGRQPVKPGGTPIPRVSTNVVQRTSLSPATSQSATKTSPLTRAAVKTSPVIPSAASSASKTSEAKINALRKQGLNVVKRVVSAPATDQSTTQSKASPTTTPTTTAGTAAQQQEADAAGGGEDSSFPVAIPPPSPPRALTLCPVTGKVLSQAEGEPTPVPSPEPKPTDKKDSEQQQEQQQDTQVQQILTNEDGSPIIVAGEDGTLYQVAGKNAEGQTILIAQGADGEQQCVLVASQEGGEGAEEGHGGPHQGQAGVLTLDAAVSEAVAQMGVTQEQVQNLPEEQQQQQQAQYKLQEGVDPNQQLTIQTEDSQDGQITAEVVQADQPSPGGTRRVVLLLPDGSFMMTEVNEEQYQSLNLVN